MSDDHDSSEIDETVTTGDGNEVPAGMVVDDETGAVGRDFDGDGELETKLCRYCVSEIDALSTRCCRCGGDLRFVEGTDIPQNWTMLFCCLALFVACIWLPIERHPTRSIYPSESFGGGFLAIFAGFGMLASYGNIMQRKAIYWPMLLAAFDGLYVGITRYVGAAKTVPDGAAPRDYLLMGGPALPIILICSLMLVWTFFKGISSGRKKDKAAREASGRR